MSLSGNQVYSNVCGPLSPTEPFAATSSDRTDKTYLFILWCFVVVLLWVHLSLVYRISLPMQEAHQGTSRYQTPIPICEWKGKQRCSCICK